MLSTRLVPFVACRLGGLRNGRQGCLRDQDNLWIHLNHGVLRRIAGRRHVPRRPRRSGHIIAFTTNFWLGAAFGWPGAELPRGGEVLQDTARINCMNQNSGSTSNTNSRPAQAKERLRA